MTISKWLFRKPAKLRTTGVKREIGAHLMATRGILNVLDKLT